MMAGKKGSHIDFKLQVRIPIDFGAKKYRKSLDQVISGVFGNIIVEGLSSNKDWSDTMDYLPDYGTGFMTCSGFYEYRGEMPRSSLIDEIYGLIRTNAQDLKNVEQVSEKDEQMVGDILREIKIVLQ